LFGILLSQQGAFLPQVLRHITASAVEALAQQDSCPYTPARELKEKTQEVIPRVVCLSCNTHVNLVYVTHAQTQHGQAPRSTGCCFENETHPRAASYLLFLIYIYLQFAKQWAALAALLLWPLLPRTLHVPCCRLASSCSKGQPVADAAGVLQVQLQSFSPTTLPAAPQTPPRAGVGQTPAARTDAGDAAEQTAGAAAGSCKQSAAQKRLSETWSYTQLSVIAVLADGVPVAAANGATDTTLVSICTAATAATACFIEASTLWLHRMHSMPCG
jgi:hypothetical protein